MRRAPLLGLALTLATVGACEKGKSPQEVQPMTAEELPAVSSDVRTRISNTTTSVGLNYPLKSTPDRGELASERAAKIRRLAELVITRPHQNGVIQFKLDPGDHQYKVEYTQAVIVHRGKRYTVTVENGDDSNDGELSRDRISIGVRPNKTTAAKDLDGFLDIGLDGHCNVGTVGGLIVINADTDGRGRRSAGEFCDEIDYLRTVDELLEFYGEAK